MFTKPSYVSPMVGFDFLSISNDRERERGSEYPILLRTCLSFHHYYMTREKVTIVLKNEIINAAEKIK